MRIVAIDPGATGAIAVFEEGVPTALYDMPTYNIKMATPKYRKQRGGGFKLDADGKRIRYYPERTVVCPVLLSSIVGDASVLGGGRDPSDTLVVLEKVEARGKDGAVGAFKFGQAYAYIESAILAHGFVPTHVLPAAWKKELSIDIANKKAGLHMARAMYGQVCDIGAEKNDGRADALLIGLFAERKLAMANAGGSAWPPVNQPRQDHLKAQLDLAHHARMAQIDSAIIARPQYDLARSAG